MDALPSIILTMPKPPSLNKLWISVPGKARVRSPEYRAWAAIAGWEIRRQIVGMPPLACRFNVDIQVPISSRDTDNWVKALLDACQTYGVIVCDGNAHRLTVEPMTRDDCLVAITPLPEMGGVRAAPKPWAPRAKQWGRPRNANPTWAQRARRAGILI